MLYKSDYRVSIPSTENELSKCSISLIIESLLKLSRDIKMIYNVLNYYFNMHTRVEQMSRG